MLGATTLVKLLPLVEVLTAIVDLANDLLDGLGVLVTALVTALMANDFVGSAPAMTGTPSMVGSEASNSVEEPSS
jgi:hypothetical protein